MACCFSYVALTITLRNITHSSLSGKLHWIGGVNNLQNYDKIFCCLIYLIIKNGNVCWHHWISCCHCNLKWLCIIKVHPCMERQVHILATSWWQIFTRDESSSHVYGILWMRANKVWIIPACQAITHIKVAATFCCHALVQLTLQIFMKIYNYLYLSHFNCVGSHYTINSAELALLM